MAVLAVLLAAVFSATHAGAALNAHLTLAGQVQGPIKGDVTTPGREDTILVSEIHHLIHLPLDPASGQPTGSLQHEPFVFTKGVDRATVGMYTALSNGESLTATFRYYKPDPVGGEIQYFTIRLVNARIIAMEPIKAEIQDPANTVFPDMERVRMIYQEIQLTDESNEQAVTINAQQP